MKVICVKCERSDVPFVVSEIDQLKRAVIAARCHGETEYYRMNQGKYRNEWARTDRALKMFKGAK